MRPRVDQVQAALATGIGGDHLPLAFWYPRVAGFGKNLPGDLGGKGATIEQIAISRDRAHRYDDRAPMVRHS